MQAKILAAEEKEYFGLLSNTHNLGSHISSETQILEQPGKWHAIMKDKLEAKGLGLQFFLGCTMGFLEVLSCGCILQFVNFVGSSKDHFDVVAFCSVVGFHASLEMWILANG